MSKVLVIVTIIAMTLTLAGCGTPDDELMAASTDTALSGTFAGPQVGDSNAGSSERSKTTDTGEGDEGAGKVPAGTGGRKRQDAYIETAEPDYFEPDHYAQPGVRSATVSGLLLIDEFSSGEGALLYLGMQALELIQILDENGCFPGRWGGYQWFSTLDYENHHSAEPDEGGFCYYFDDAYDRVYYIWVSSDEYLTKAGLRVGDSAERVVELYGSDYREYTGADNGRPEFYEYAIGGQYLRISFLDGIVFSWAVSKYSEATYLDNPEPPEGESLTHIRDEWAESNSGWVGTTIAAGPNNSFLIKPDGSLWTWGFYKDSEGKDPADSIKRSPTKIMDGVAKVASGEDYTLVVKTDGGLWAWGNIGWSFRGVGPAFWPEPVKIMDDVAIVATNKDKDSHYILAVKTDGSLWAFGKNQYGTLGDGTMTDRLEPVKIMDGVVSVSAGRNHTIAVQKDGSLWAWGANNNGQLGDGTAADSLKPVKIMDDAASVSAGAHFSTAIKRDGSLWAWGSNSNGQLGNGTAADSKKPVKVMNDVVSVSAGHKHTMAIKHDGSLWAWGCNNAQQLGVGELYYEDQHAPLLILVSVAAVEAGGSHTIAVRSAGSLWVWGSNRQGQLGDGQKYDDSYMFKLMQDVTTLGAPKR